MSLKDSLKLSSGWGWGLVGFAVSTLLSWMAPFGQLPKMAFENAYQRFEQKLVRRGTLDGLKLRQLDFGILLDYPGDLVDFKGSLQIENSTSSDIKVRDIRVTINDTPVKIRLWETVPGHLEAKEKKEYVFYTSSIPRDSQGRYHMNFEVFDSLGRNYSVQTQN